MFWYPGGSGGRSINKLFTGGLVSNAYKSSYANLVYIAAYKNFSETPKYSSGLLLYVTRYKWYMKIANEPQHKYFKVFPSIKKNFL